MAAAAGTALLALVGACSSDTPTDAFAPLAPARLALDASVRFQTTGSASLRVRSSYVRTDLTRPPLDSQNISLTDAPSQQVPITIDLGPCLSDPLRGSATGGTPAADECLVWVELALLTNGVVVDRDTLKNISMRPGQTASAPASITLDEVGTVRLLPPSANVVSPGAPLRLEATRTMTIGAEVLDGANRPLTRPVTWSTASATIATVTNAGVVTGVAPGTVRLTATVGSSTASVDVRVVPLPQAVTITAGTGSSGTGTVVSVPAGLNCAISGTTTSGTCTASFPGDASVSLTMTTGSSTSFVGWGGDCSGASACTFATSQPRAVSATLRAFRTLTVTGIGPGNGSITAPGNVINCTWQFGSTSSGPCTAQIPDGTQITLTAAAQANSRFAGWRGDCAAATGLTCTLTMSANRSVQADFGQLAVYRISAGTGTGNGSVLSSPAGINCTVTGTAVSGTCSMAVLPGTVVSLSAQGSGGSTFRQWGGTCGGATAVCVRSNTNGGDFPSTVAFDNAVALNITPDPRSTGTGQLNGTSFFFCTISATTVTSAPCANTYPIGTTVTIDAFTTGFTDFVAWGGACASFIASRCTLTMNSSTAATVRFEAVPTARLRLQLDSDRGSVQVSQAPYLGQQTCVRSTANQAPTICDITVARNRQMVITIVDSPPIFGSFNEIGVCALASSPCVTSINADAQADIFFFDSQALIMNRSTGSQPAAQPSRPSPVKRKGAARQ
ncbi:hypothetical protein GEMMAAP_19225 [Gemmatimonas phototrophica]|uniref:BIG2 domain-containing protein n=1 Tax=Gemmatimonas phototrophica TaxID=1379270 RepID=A0A143BMU0_9BACT|nr:hypothetical protein GEMMAAP_19225 [Gemmatimonas phototrophica]